MPKQGKWAVKRNVKDIPRNFKSLGYTLKSPGVTSQWARWARQPGYFFNSRFNMDVSRYHEFSFPVLACIFDDDIYVPEKSVKALLERMPKADIEIKKINGISSGLGRIGHFGFFRERMKDTLWPETAAWLLRQTE